MFSAVIMPIDVFNECVQSKQINLDFSSRFVVLYQVIAYICHSFVPSGFPIGSAKLRMKRESGESPGQSRCCKLLEEACLPLQATAVS